MATKAQKAAQKRWNSTTTQFMFRFRNVADADVIERLKGIKGRTEYIRELVRRDINGEK